MAAMTLRILPKTISDDVEVSISLDDQQFIGNMDVVFQPHGITFSQPAILNIAASGLDLTGMNPNAIDIYYDNTETGQWEKMEREAILVNIVDGAIVVVNALLPHFSRYAIGAE